jgi:hypothetical protein
MAFAAVSGVGALTSIVGGQVVPLELAGSARAFFEAKAVLEAAGKSPWWGTVIDYAFIVTYIIVAGGLALYAGTRLGIDGWRRAGEWFMRAAIVAGLLDVIENTLILIMLAGEPQDSMAVVVAGAAGVKFLLLLGGTVPFVLLAWARGWFPSAGQPRRS